MPTVDRESVFHSGAERTEVTLFTDDTISLRYYTTTEQITFDHAFAASSLEQGESSEALVNLLTMSSAMKSACSTAVQNEQVGQGQRDQFWHGKKTQIFVDQFTGDETENDVVHIPNQ